MLTLPDQLAAWSCGIAHELAFWDQVLRTGGGEWPEDWRRRLDPGSPLDPFLAVEARALGGPAIRILDVGAGPVTGIGYTLPGVSLDILPVDPLALPYAALLRRHGLVPPLATAFGLAEDLTLTLPAAAFDLVHCRNALDHSYDPLRGIEQMLAMVRVGGRLLLRHFPDEAEREAYAGFHRFNLRIRDSRFIVWNRDGETDVASRLVTPARVTVGATGAVDVIIEKTGPSPAASPAEERQRIAACLAGLVAAFAGPAPDSLAGGSAG